MRASWFCIGLLWLGSSLPAMAQNAGIARLQRLGDPSAATSAALPTLPPDAFVELDDRQRLAGAVDGRGWWRLQPTPADMSSPDRPDDRLLLVYHPYSARVTVLAPPDYRARTQRLFDRDLDPRHARRALVFPLNGDGPVYIGVEGARYPLQVAVRSAGAHAAADLDHVRVLSLCVGVLLGVGSMALLFWLLLRERVYLLYAANMALQGLYVLCVYGEAYALPGLRWLAPFGAAGVWVIATLATVVSVYFLLDFADLRRRAPRLSRALVWVGSYASLALLVVLLSPWPADKHWFPALGNGVLMLANLLALATLFTAWRRGGRHAGVVLLAWLPLVAASTARAVQLNAGAPLTSWLEYGLPAALAFSAVVLGLGLADRMLAFRRERDQAQRHAEHDALTGVLNRSAIEERCGIAIADARRLYQDLSVLFMDLDHFKRINDTYGHDAGDVCLRTLAEVVAAETRYGDLFGRLGGEEFLLLMPTANARRARDTAERIRRTVEHRQVQTGGAEIALTVSIGVAQCGPDDTVASLIRRADQAMYAAKHAGRNRVVVADTGAA